MSLLIAVKSAGLIGDARDGRFHVGLVERDLRGVDRLGDDNALGDGLAPVLRVHGLAFPERREGEPEARGRGSDDAVDMAANAPAGDREAELLAVGLALAGVEIEAGGTQPADRQVLERMADREDAQRLGRRSPAPSSFGAPANSNCSARSQAWPRREPPR